MAYLTLQATREGQAAHAHVNEIVRNLRILGWDIDLYEPNYPEGSVGVLKRGWEFIRVQAKVISRMRDYDVLYIRAHPCALLAAACAKFKRLVVIQECNGPYQDLFSAWPVLRFLRLPLVHSQRYQYRAATRNIAVTEGLRLMVNGETHRRDTRLISNGADVDLFRPGSEVPAGFPLQYVIFFGALAPWQGVDTLLSATEEPGWPENVTLVIAGDGAQRALVEDVASHNPRVKYVGKLAYRDVPAAVAGSIASLSVKCADSHTTSGLAPVKVFESMACGVPVIVSDHAGLADLVRDAGVGLVVRAGDPTGLALAVSDLAADRERASSMGRRARELCVGHHSWLARARSTEDLLIEACAGVEQEAHSDGMEGGPREAKVHRPV